MMTDFLQTIIKDSGNEYAGLVEDGVDGSDVTGFVNTGSLAFNALLSGDIYGGIPDNKIVAIAGESATGKTYFALDVCKKFLADNEEAAVLYFDSEQAITSSMVNGPKAGRHLPHRYRGRLPTPVHQDRRQGA